MKKLLFILAFLSTSALAIDRPVPCTGNSCKILFETTSGAGAKVSAGQVDGGAEWIFGPSTQAADHVIRGNLQVRSKSGVQETFIVYDNTLANKNLVVTNAGAVTLGPSGFTGVNTINGKGRTIRSMEVGGIDSSGSFAALYQAAINPAATTTCNTRCQTSATNHGYPSATGACLITWIGGSTATCGDTSNNVKFCLCAGLN